MATPTPALKIGILGCANIARGFVSHVAHSPAVQVVAVASRSAEKAQAFAREFGLARAHASYEALLADPDVQAVYIPLPNSLHAPWAMAAAAQGKHVLCEKPLALNHAQAQGMFDAARQHGVMLLEAYPWWFQPQTRELLRLLQAGVLGELRSVQASFGFTLSNPVGNIRFQPDLGGGALLDAGSYCLSLIRLVMGDLPQSVHAQACWSDGGPEKGVDTSLMATLRWADGRRAQLSCAMDGANHRYASIVGSQGVIETEYLNHTGGPDGNPQGWQPSVLRLRTGTAHNLPFEDVPSATGSGFRFAAEAFARLVAERDFAAMERAAQASLDIATLLQALAQSARSEQTVRLA